MYRHPWALFRETVSIVDLCLFISSNVPSFFLLAFKTFTVFSILGPFRELYFIWLPSTVVSNSV